MRGPEWVAVCQRGQMSMDPVDRPGPSDSRVPASVTELAAVRAWTVAVPAKGSWTTAERVIEGTGHRWVIGMTPTTGRAIALIPWCDDTVAAHIRGAEAEMCQRAFGWATELLAGRAPLGPAGPC